MVPNGASRTPTSVDGTGAEPSSSVGGSTDAADPTAIIIGAVVGALVCIMCVVLILALLHRRRERKMEQADIDAIKSTAMGGVGGGAPSFSDASFGHSFAPIMAPPTSHDFAQFGSSSRSLTMSAAGHQCPVCGSIYPTQADVAHHMQKRHTEAPSGGYATAEWASNRPQVTYETAMPFRGSGASTHAEPTNAYNLPPYATQTEERFAKFHT